ncbi:MAG: hypothetical protein LBQ35_08500 [Spirochaetaceae bacterium]|jgi:uncharacterized membrane protein|nr:hypothetical protein [Spirochaetaceae bacterium]
MKKSGFIVAGILALALVSGLVMAGCGDGAAPPPAFDGSTLAGTTWGYGETEDFDGLLGGLSIEIEFTLTFTSATEGTTEFKITKWNGEWTAELKGKIETAFSEDHDSSSSFTYEYDPATYTGTMISDSGSNEDFTVDVEKRELTIEDGEEPTVLTLR